MFNVFRIIKDLLAHTVEVDDLYLSSKTLGMILSSLDKVFIFVIKWPILSLPLSPFCSGPDGYTRLTHLKVVFFLF